MAQRVVLVHGAAGALGREIVKRFRQSKPWLTIGVDIVPAAGDAAHHSIVLPKEHALQPTLQCETLFKQLELLLGGRGPRIDAVISASGGFAMGNAQDPQLLASCEAMFSSSIFSSFVAVHTSATFGKPRILTVLPGAAAVASPNGTPWGLAYGSSKAGVHQMVRSLGTSPHEATGLPPGSKVVGFAPVTLDTPGNRAGMPDADTSAWTPLPHLADTLFAWADDPSTCTSGVVYKPDTKGGVTSFAPLDP